jgi:phospholipid/cholesterol/gamma-HCH transport system permease protein
MGLNVESNARSLGQSTTSTVVQSIVLVIIIDALFAAAFAKFGYY